MRPHTPGPWFVTHELRDSDQTVCDLVNDTWVVAGGQLGCWNADARLIAAAPDLLIALQVVLSVVDSNCSQFDIARRAIAKATQP